MPGDAVRWARYCKVRVGAAGLQGFYILAK